MILLLTMIRTIINFIISKPLAGKDEKGSKVASLSVCHSHGVSGSHKNVDTEIKKTVKANYHFLRIHSTCAALRRVVSAIQLFHYYLLSRNIRTALLSYLTTILDKYSLL